jgi:hypothetical protein
VTVYFHDPGGTDDSTQLVAAIVPVHDERIVWRAFVPASYRRTWYPVTGCPVARVDAAHETVTEVPARLADGVAPAFTDVAADEPLLPAMVVASQNAHAPPPPSTSMSTVVSEAITRVRRGAGARISRPPDRS